MQCSVLWQRVCYIQILKVLIFWRQHFEGVAFQRCVSYSKAAQYFMHFTGGRIGLVVRGLTVVHFQDRPTDRHTDRWATWQVHKISTYACLVEKVYCSVLCPRIESHCSLVFITTTIAIYSLWHGLCTLTAVPRLTQPSTFRRMVKWVLVNARIKSGDSPLPGGR